MTKEPETLRPEVQRWIESRADAPPSAQPQLSIVIPAYNEQWRIPSTLIDVIDYFARLNLPYEVIVVDDGSRDQTGHVIEKFQNITPGLRLIRLAENRGKGHAVRVGVLNARGKRILFADADGATPIAEIERLVKAIDQGSDVAIGSRALSSEDTKVITRWYRKYLGRVFNLMVNWWIVPEIADTQCGFKLFTAEAADFIFKRQRCDGFAFDVELLYLARRSGMRIAEVPVNWTNVPGSKVNLAVDSILMFLEILKIPLRHRTVARGAYMKERPS
ncbi:MAG: glycosyl transferase family 2 [Proteobacteria bacterium]|nr:MAG: glycosyl transferase family 2 [Pseudomonadota bacterium]